ncbi:Twisted gastrulation (Tsg) protein conserved region [Popillia japonica]|uniref:Twisted gastrulation (Tsg) protein conserved region n=1 Tax=Popillia japonica TaxID=7064 RepID=A0AAW1JUV6_POPJA
MKVELRTADIHNIHVIQCHVSRQCHPMPRQQTIAKSKYLKINKILLQQETQRYPVICDVEACNHIHSFNCIVSKCLLTQSCKCDLKNCSCCKECSSCLSFQYSQCCSCVDLCPKPNDTGVKLSKQSNIEDFPEKMPELFKALTESPDSQDRWVSFTYPVDFDIAHIAPIKDYKLQLQSSDPDAKPLPIWNCTVAFMAECMSWAKCKNNCQSMGASSLRWFHNGCCECIGDTLRWFHNGCCECIGDTCINYGLNEAKCSKCSQSEQVEEEVRYDDDIQYDDLNYDDDDVPVGDDDID